MEIIARLANLPGALPGACAQGLIWGIMAIGVYLTYRILDVADLTVDGSFGTGGAVCVMCLLSGMNVWLALLVAVLAGLATGLVTGLDINIGNVIRHMQLEVQPVSETDLLDPDIIL